MQAKTRAEARLWPGLAGGASGEECVRTRIWINIVYIDIYTYILYRYIHIYLYTYIHPYIYTHIHLHIHLNMHMYIYIDIHVYVCIYIYVYICK